MTTRTVNVSNGGRLRVVTILTLFVCAMWTITAVVRLFMAWPAATVLDAAMPLVIGNWFAATAKKNGGRPA